MDWSFVIALLIVIAFFVVSISLLTKVFSFLWNNAAAVIVAILVLLFFGGS